MSNFRKKCILLLWWLCNVKYHFGTRYLYEKQPRAMNWAIFCKYMQFLEMTMMQCLLGAIISACILKFAKKKPLVFPISNKQGLWFVTFCHVSGSLALNAAVSMHSGHIQDLFRSFEPVVVVIILIYNGYMVKSNVFFGLAFMCTGLYMFMQPSNLIFTKWSLIASFLALVSFPLRNVYIKLKVLPCIGPLETYYIIAVFGCIILLPIVLLKLVYTQIFQLLNPTEVLQSVAFHFLDNIISLFMVEWFSLLFQSVLRGLMQYSIAIWTVIYFIAPVSWYMSIGMVLFHTGLLFYQHFTSSNELNLRRYITIVLLAFYLILGGSQLNRTIGLKQHKSGTIINTFWVYNEPPNREMLRHLRNFNQETSTDKLHVFCGTFSCIERIKYLNRRYISASFMKDIGRNSPLEKWFKAHSLHKILSGDNFEAHLHEATKLSLVWGHGGIFVDPFFETRNIIFEDRGSWIARLGKGNSSGILAFRFKKGDPFINVLANTFVKGYHQLCYLTENCDNLLQNFYVQSWKDYASFCSKYTRKCPKIFEIEGRTIGRKYIEHFDVNFEKLHFKSLATGIRELAMIQFLPFVKISNSKNASLTQKQNRSFGKLFDLTFLYRSENAPYSLSYFAFVRQKQIVKNDVKTSNTENSPTLIFDGLGLLTKTPLPNNITRNGTYFVDLNQSIFAELPLKIRESGVYLAVDEKQKFSPQSWAKLMYAFCQKIAGAKLVITSDVQCASLAVSYNTPVLLVINQINERESLLTQIFHSWDPNNSTLDSTAQLMSKLLSGKMQPVSHLGLFMRLRATFWSVLRRYDYYILESALKFGVVPFTRPLMNPKEYLVFHLVFTTSERNLISLDHTSNLTRGSFSWRHWRCIESIFYHHPLATVIIHSNTLVSKTFDVLRESGYDIQLKPYNVSQLAENTPAEIFVRDELPYAKEGPHWYSHETDLLRLLILFKYGGIYMDIDMIIVRELYKLPPNVIGWESSKNMNGAFLKFQKSHPYLYECIREFSERYSQAWSDNGPLLLTRVWRKWSKRYIDNDVTAVGRFAFYMFFYRHIQRQCFEETAGNIFHRNWRVLTTQAYAVHLYSKITAGYHTNIKNKTLCKHILNSFCVLCSKVY